MQPLIDNTQVLFGKQSLPDKGLVNKASDLKYYKVLLTR